MRIVITGREGYQPLVLEGVRAVMLTYKNEQGAALTHYDGQLTEILMLAALSLAAAVEDIPPEGRQAALNVVRGIIENAMDHTVTLPIGRT